MGWKKRLQAPSHSFDVIRDTHAWAVEDRQPRRDLISWSALWWLQGRRVGVNSVVHGDTSDKYDSGDSTTEFITFPDVVRANGWMMKTRLEEGSQLRDPRRFILHFSLPTSSKRTLDDCLWANDWLPDTTGRGVSKLSQVESFRARVWRRVVFVNESCLDVTWPCSKSCVALVSSTTQTKRLQTSATPSSGSFLDSTWSGWGWWCSLNKITSWSCHQLQLS